jgi:hypothetical protein
MRFALLIVGSDSAYQALTEDDTKEMYAAHERLGAMLAAKGAMVGGAELLTDTRIVGTDGGTSVVTAGPFTETTEGIGGWDAVEAGDMEAVEAGDMDAAVEYAKQVPILPTDHVEVRPLRG